jgi:uncharacterized damage-inducible protein DinB
MFASHWKRAAPPRKITSATRAMTHPTCQDARSVAGALAAGTGILAREIQLWERPMDALDLLRRQAGMAEEVNTMVLGALSPEQAVWKPDGSAANAIAATLLHMYWGEDRWVNQVQGRPTLFERDGWQQRLGVDAASVWTAPALPGIADLRAYAGAVHAETRAYMHNLQPAALEQEIDTPLGRQPLAMALTIGLVSHKQMHIGEIAGLLGVQGVKGLPF